MHSIFSMEVYWGGTIYSWFYLHGKWLTVWKSGRKTTQYRGIGGQLIPVRIWLMWPWVDTMLVQTPFSELGEEMAYMIPEHLHHSIPRYCKDQISKTWIYHLEHNKDISCASPKEGTPESCVFNFSISKSSEWMVFHGYHLTETFFCFNFPNQNTENLLKLSVQLNDRYSYNLFL